MPGQDIYRYAINEARCAYRYVELRVPPCQMSVWLIEDWIQICADLINTLQLKSAQTEKSVFIYPSKNGTSNDQIIKPHKY